MRGAVPGAPQNELSPIVPTPGDSCFSSEGLGGRALTRLVLASPG